MRWWGGSRLNLILPPTEGPKRARKVPVQWPVQWLGREDPRQWRCHVVGEGSLRLKGHALPVLPVGSCKPSHPCRYSHYVAERSTVEQCVALCSGERSCLGLETVRPTGWARGVGARKRSRCSGSLLSCPLLEPFNSGPS